MSEKETGRRRASRIPLDYHHAWDMVSRIKWIGAAAALMLTAGYVAWGWGSSQGVKRYSHGELALAHATWETQCEVCHVPFEPIRSDSVAQYWTSTNATDQRCKNCHAGPPHHARQIASEVESCAACHRDHQGRLADLTRVTDKSCVRCHERIEDHIAKEARGEPTRLANVASFPDVHPDFSSLKTDPGKLKFTHARHVARGLISAAPSDTNEQPLTYEAWRRRADGHGHVPADQPGGDLVQLDCAACHRPDNHETASAGLGHSPGGRGEYMAPIKYEADCRSCHPLHLLPGRDELVPHGLSGEQLRGLLVEIFAQQAEIERPTEELRRSLGKRPLPSQRLTEEERRALEQLADNVARAEGHLRTACALCHEYQSSSAGDFGLFAGLGVDVPSEPVQVEHPNVPATWLKHARFDHQAHRAMKCLECHPNAEQSRAASDVLIDHRKVTCANCHSKQRVVDGKPFGGAQFDCVECHRYHAADHAVAQSGDSRGVAPDLRKTLEDFLAPNNAN